MITELNPEMTKAKQGSSRRFRLRFLEAMSEPSLKGQTEVSREEERCSLATERDRAPGRGPGTDKGTEVRNN